MMGTFRWRTSEEPRYCKVDLFQPRILRLDDILGGLNARRNWCVLENDMGGTQMSVRMEKDLRLMDFGEIWLVNQVKVGGREILVCINLKKKK